MASWNKAWECFAAQDLEGAVQQFGNACGYDYMACLFHYGLRFVIKPDTLPFQVKIVGENPKITEEQRQAEQNKDPSLEELEEEDFEGEIYLPRVPLEIISACHTDADSCCKIGGIIMGAMFIEDSGIYPYRGRYEQLSNEEKEMEDSLFRIWISGHRQF